MTTIVDTSNLFENNLRIESLFYFLHNYGYFEHFTVLEIFLEITFFLKAVLTFIFYFKVYTNPAENPIASLKFLPTTVVVYPAEKPMLSLNKGT